MCDTLALSQRMLPQGSTRNSLEVPRKCPLPQSIDPHSPTAAELGFASPLPSPCADNSADEQALNSREEKTTQRGFKALFCRKTETAFQAPSLRDLVRIWRLHPAVSPISGLYLRSWACNSDFPGEIRIILLNISPESFSGLLQ